MPLLHITQPCVLEAEEHGCDDTRQQILEALEKAQAELELLRRENAKLARSDFMQDLVTSICVALAVVVRVPAGPAGLVATAGAVGAWKLIKYVWNRFR